MKRFICLILAAIMLFSLCACGEKTVDAETALKGLLSEDKNAQSAAVSRNVKLKHAVNLCSSVKADAMEPAAEITDSQRTAITDFSMRLLRQCNESGKNIMLSPLSVLYALGMTVNGADGETLREMEDTLGFSVGELNSVLNSCMSKLTGGENCKLNMADSIWIRNDPSLQVNEDFLKTCVSCYNSQVYNAPFDDSTVKDINSWASGNTYGMIDQVLDRIKDEEIMFLINAIAFDARWDEPYEEYQVKEDRIFTDENGNETSVTLLYGAENTFLETEKATGFIKDYKGRKYGFAALLPNEGVTVDELLASLDGEELARMLAQPQYTEVWVRIPEFESRYGTSLSEALKDMGMPQAFDENDADFSKMATVEDANVCIGNVIHQTYISVDRDGTKAAAVTMVSTVATTAIADEPEPKIVYLDRPFVYMIIDKETNVPIFIGTTMHIN